MARHLNHRLAKIHLTYTVEEIARRWGLHRNTVRAWIKSGLPTIDDKRPLLIHGRDLAEFLRARRQQRRRPCAPGELYCVRCRVPRRPAGAMADYEPLSDAYGNIVGICPVCERLMNRRVARQKIDEVRGQIEVQFKHAPPHINDREGPSVNCAFSAGVSE